MKIRPRVLFVVAVILLLNSNSNAAPKNINPGTYGNWGRMINKLEIIQSFKIANYSQLVIAEIDISNIQYHLDGFSDDLKRSLTKEGLRIFIDKIMSNPKHLKIIETSSKDFNKTLILKIAISKIGVEKGSVWWHPLAWVEIQGELIASQNNEVLLKFETRRTTSVKGLSGGSVIKDLDEEGRKLVITAINNDFMEIGGDLTELIFSFL